MRVHGWPQPSAVTGRVPMTYEISFRSDAEAAFETLDSEAVSHIEKKLEQVATCEYRSPTDWDYSSWDGGQAEGKFNWGAYRVFADIDERRNEIVVDQVRHRENLYR